MQRFVLGVTDTDDLPSVIDTEGIRKNPRRALRLKSIQVGHLAVRPQEWMSSGSRDIRCSHYVAVVVYP